MADCLLWRVAGIDVQKLAAVKKAVAASEIVLVIGG